MGSKYDTNAKAQALALLELGKPASHVAQELVIPVRTVQRWAVGWREMAAKEGDKALTDRDYRLSIRVEELLHVALDQLEERGELYKQLIPLNAIRGTSVDKILKRQEAKHQPQAQAQSIQINFIVQPPPPDRDDAIEGEVIEERDGT